MLENTTAGASVLQSLPISEFVSALVGGGLAFAGTIYSLRHQQTQRNKRLRRALVSEIISIEAGQLHLMASMLRTGEGGSDFLDEFVENHYDELTDGLPSEMAGKLRDELMDTDELKQEAMRKAGVLIAAVNLTTPVWDSNTDKIGDLETDEIEEIIRFYRLLGTCKHHAENAVDDVEGKSEPDDDEASDRADTFDSHMWALQKNARALTEKKKEALEALGASEFLEIKDTYLICR